MKLQANSLAGFVPFLWPVPLPAVTEIAPAFPALPVTGPKSAASPTNGAKDFRNLLNSLEDAAPGLEDSAQIESPMPKSVKAGPNKTRTGSSKEQESPDDAQSADQMDSPPVPTAIAQPINWDKLPFLWSLPALNVTSQATQQAEPPNATADHKDATGYVGPLNGRSQQPSSAQEDQRITADKLPAPTAPSLTPNTPLPPAPTPQPTAGQTTHEAHALPLIASQIAIKQSQSSFAQPMFTAFEAKLSPRNAQAKPSSGFVSPPDGKLAGPEHAENSPKTQSETSQHQSSTTESELPKPKLDTRTPSSEGEANPEKSTETTSSVTHANATHHPDLSDRPAANSTGQISFAQPAAISPNARTLTAQAHTASASAPDLIEPPTPPPTGPARDISFRLGNSAADSVNVKIVDRAGQIHVAVQSGDSAVAQTLQSNVKELASKLETSGFHTETIIPGRTPAVPDSQQNQAFQDFQQNRRAPEQEQRVQKKRRSSEDAAFTLIPNQEN